jgi:competence protein ComEA
VIKTAKILGFFSIFIPILLIVVGIVLASLAIKKLIAESETLQCFCPSCPQTAFAEKGINNLGFIKVDIQGAVKKPGIYQLVIGQRIADLVASASGFVIEADASYIAKTLNLATELKDQDKIYIPFLEENQDQDSENSSSDTETSSQSESKLISVNQANLDALQTLSGIGAVKAQAIIDNRPYSNLDDLVSKKVLSENLLSNLKAQLSL